MTTGSARLRRTADFGCGTCCDRYFRIICIWEIIIWRLLRSWCLRYTCYSIRISSGELEVADMGGPNSVVSDVVTTGLYPAAEVSDVVTSGRFVPVPEVSDVTIGSI
ncbi:hypothetical protein EVAR_72799_1 [Eumeta japonica]|uniref:Uncharacterized protein n=1 Tax=Eumeta variegata TaxID=151549 RepID=A0A4C1SRX1_EUMVA|nr:hypothetical protein EVAR_72799_1 [Eumeta japonica]